MTTETKPLNVEIFKLMGWEYVTGEMIDYHDGYTGWINSMGEEVKLPTIHENCQLMLDWLVPFMRERGYEYHISLSGDFWWRTGGILKKYAIIEKDNVALAACEAALPILKELAKEKG